MRPIASGTSMPTCAGLANRSVYTFYSLLASRMSRQTLTHFEHRSGGDDDRIYGLVGPMSADTQVLSSMLCYDEGDDLVFCHATPRAWLAPGITIRGDGLQTRFGPTSFTLEATDDSVTGTIDVPQRHAPKAVRLVLRADGEFRDVRLNGKPAVWDPSICVVEIPLGHVQVRLEAMVTRRR